jgi:hypothetical protein
MKKIVLSLVALGALSSAAFATTAYDKQLKRNTVENPDHYAAVVNANNLVAGDALAIEAGASASGIKRFAGPGEDGRQGR